MHWSFNYEAAKWALIGGALALLFGTIAYLVNRRSLTREERVRLRRRGMVAWGATAVWALTLYVLWRFGFSANASLIPTALWLILNLWLSSLSVRTREHKDS